MSTILPPPDRNRLVAILGRLGSDFDGERAAAGLLATRMLQGLGLQWDEVVAPPAIADSRPAPKSWRAEVYAAMDAADVLSPWENDFLANLAHRPAISAKQRRVLDRIVLKVAAKGAR